MENQSISTIAISASFTAEPLEESLNFRGKEFHYPFEIELVPCNQTNG
jgi:hypothetical protein